MPRKNIPKQLVNDTFNRKDNPYNPIKKFTVCEKKPEYIGSYTIHYTSFNDKTWTTYH